LIGCSSSFHNHLIIMVDAQQTLESHSAIKVVLLPVGNISSARFNQFAELIRSYSMLPIQNLTRPGGYSHERSPFKEFSWENGALYFHFCDSPDQMQSNWEDFQGHKRTLAAIGICDCPNCDDLPLAYKQFDKAVREYRHVKLKRCFAFDHAFDSNVVEETAGLKDLVMFPEDQMIGEGMSSVNLHMQVVLNTLAVSLIQLFENDIIETLTQVSKAKVSEALLLKTLMDDDDMSKKKLKQRLPGRVRKWVGDYCLLACAPGDAMGHYIAAIELTKQYSDHIWHGAALEGVSCALVAGARLSALINASHRGAPPQADADIRYGYSPDAAERCQDAISLYRKQLIMPGTGGCAPVLALVIEASFKLARYYGTVANPPQIPKALTLIRDTDPIYAPGSEMLRHQTQIQITLQTALLCEAMGLRRKFAFYMQRAARLYRHSYCWPACHAFSMLAARVYGVKGIDEVSYDDLTNEEAAEAAAEAAAAEAAAAGELGVAGDGATSGDGATGAVVAGADAVEGGSGEEHAHSEAKKGLDGRPYASYTPDPAGGEDWRRMQQLLLEELVVVGYSMGEYRMVATYLVALLKLLAATEGRRRSRKGSAQTVAAPSTAMAAPQHGGSLVAQLAAAQQKPHSMELQRSSSSDGITDIPLSPRNDDEPQLTLEQQQKQQREAEQRDYMKQQLQQQQPMSFAQPSAAQQQQQEQQQQQQQQQQQPHCADGNTSSGGGGRSMSSMRSRMKEMKAAGLDKMEKIKAAGMDKLGQASPNGTPNGNPNEDGAGSGTAGGNGEGGDGGEGGADSKPSTHSVISFDDFLSGGNGGAAPADDDGDATYDNVPSSHPSVSMEGVVESQQTIQRYAAGLRAQHDVARQLVAVTQGLPPNYRVDMSGLPTVVRIWPLAPPQPKLAVPKKAAGGASGFYYNPYADKGRKLDGKGAGEDPMQWVAGELAQVRVLLHNPTALELHVQRVQLVFAKDDDSRPSATITAGAAGAAADQLVCTPENGDGANGANGANGAATAECYPSSVILPAGAHRELVLSAKPRVPGKLKIRAIKIVCFGLHWEHSVGADGEGTSKPLPMSKTAAMAMAAAMGEERGPRQYMAAALNAAAAAAKIEGGKQTNKITVLPPMPLLQCNLQEWQPVPLVAVAGAGAAGDVAVGGAGSGIEVEGNYAMLPLLRGERSTMHLCLECVGAVSVGEVEVSIEPVMRRSKIKGIRAMQLAGNDEMWEEAEEKVGATELVFKGAIEDQQKAEVAEGEEKEGHSSVTGQSGVYYNDPVMRGRHGEMVEQEIVPDILRWDETSLRRFGGSLPLLSQCSFVLPVELLASPAYSGVNVVIGYAASPNSSYKRSLTLPLRLSFSPSLELLGLQVVAHPVLRTTVGTSAGKIGAGAGAEVGAGAGAGAGAVAGSSLESDLALLLPQETDAPTCSVVLQISNPSRFPMVLNCEVDNEASKVGATTGSGEGAQEGAAAAGGTPGKTGAAAAAATGKICSSLVIDPGAVRSVPLEWVRGSASMDSLAGASGGGGGDQDWKKRAVDQATQVLQQRLQVQWSSFAHGSSGELCPGMPQVREHPLLPSLPALSPVIDCPS
jgi:hypothetical protein